MGNSIASLRLHFLNCNKIRCIYKAMTYIQWLWIANLVPLIGMMQTSDSIFSLNGTLGSDYPA